jgi:hypothetical protein
MMGKFYLQTSEVDRNTGDYVLYELHATTNISIAMTSTLTTYPIESGADVADNIVVKNKKIDLSGIVTDVSQAGTTVSGSTTDLLTSQAQDGNQIRSVEHYIEELKKRIDNKETFTVHFSNVLKPIRNCVITNFTYNKTNTLGGEAWMIKISLSEARFANRARFVAEPALDWQPLLAGLEKSNAAKSGASDKNGAAAGLQAKSSFFGVDNGGGRYYKSTPLR